MAALTGATVPYADGGRGNRAGPSLHGIFGPHIATLPGYNFSDPLGNIGNHSLRLLTVSLPRH